MDVSRWFRNIAMDVSNNREEKEISSDCKVEFLGLEYLLFNIILDIINYIYRTVLSNRIQALKQNKIFYIEPSNVVTNIIL